MFIYIALLKGSETTGESELTRLSVSPMETIASLKDKYLQTGKCPTPNYIALKFRVYLYIFYL